MTTCRDIVTRALQMSGIVALGRDPKAAEIDAGMVSLQSLYDEWVNLGMFGRLTDVYVTEAYTAKEGERVHGATVTLPDPITTDGDARAPRQFACIVTINAGAAVNNVYHDGDWRVVSSLVLGDDAPFASISADGLAGCVAERLASTFGGDISIGAARAAKAFKTALSYKLGSTQPEPTQVYY